LVDVDERYQLLRVLGAGGFGKVYLAKDRLGGLVAIKQLHAGRYKAFSPHAHPPESGFGSALKLAHEFEVLASLRHPNIIGVLDYGFDGLQRPYLVLEVLENARKITDAGRNQPLEVQVGLLVQMLQALIYLHRRGIIHRDVKPANVLVVDRQVKLLDFGLAVPLAQQIRAMSSGTPGYLAPEVLQGESPSVLSDIYAVGVIAYELFVGTHPYEQQSPRPVPGGGSPPDWMLKDRSSDAGGSGSEALETDIAWLIGKVLTVEHEVRICEAIEVPDTLEPKLARVLRQLLAFEPRDRFQSADEAITALREATGLSLPEETAITRESFLQAARFVGRERELALFDQALMEAEHREQGHAWLVAGESGVGKSRLLDELRIRALVQGAVVLRGQAIGERGSPYHPWREVLRGLSLFTGLDDREAAILKPLVPDIGSLLQREIPDPEPLDAQAAHLRLLTTVEEVFGRMPRPAVVFLEDLHWADSATLSLLAWLARLAPRTPLLLLGSYRDDERPRLPGELPGMEVLKLPRLGTEDIAVLSESMMGSAGRNPRVVSLLERETEGNPFFLVEVIRALAEESGRLDRIGQAPLPARAFVGGMRTIVGRRLGMVPPGARELLRLAAVLGREIHEELLHEAEPTLDLAGWLGECADAAVLEVAGNQWRFAHDKLREGLLEQLAPAVLAGLHRRAAGLIEAVHPEEPAWVVALAYHWGAAGDPVKEALYSERAGAQALQVGACHEAIRFLQRARSLMEAIPAVAGPPEFRARRLGHLEALFAEALFQINDLAGFRQHAEHALRYLGQPLPSHQLGWARSTAGQLLLRILQRAWPAAFAEHSRKAREVRLEAARLCLRLNDLFIYLQQPLPLLWSGLRLLNLAGPAGACEELARGYAGMAVIASTVPLRRLARAWSTRALKLAEREESPSTLAFVLVRIGVVSAVSARWAEADAYLERALGVVDGLGDYRLAEESRLARIFSSCYQGRFTHTLPLAKWLQDSARRRQAEHYNVGWYQEAASLLRLGRVDEAFAELESVLPKVESTKIPVELVWVFGALALCGLRRGDMEAARRAAERVLELSRGRQVAHFNYVGLSSALEVYSELLERARREGLPPAELAALKKGTRLACKRVRAFSRVFLFGKPMAWLGRGNNAWLSGHPLLARWAWRRSLVWARRLSMPYEEARACMALGRCLKDGHPARREHFLRAIETFTRLGTSSELEVARALLASCGA
jgi:tetratricopeptide (TPR) repeat protein